MIQHKCSTAYSPSTEVSSGATCVSTESCVLYVLQSLQSHSFCLPRPDSLLLYLSSVHAAEAVAMEQHSLHSVYQLVLMCCECVALWRVLCEGNMNLTAGKLGAVSGRRERGEESGKREGKKEGERSEGSGKERERRKGERRRIGREGGYNVHK